MIAKLQSFFHRVRGDRRPCFLQWGVFGVLFFIAGSVLFLGSIEAKIESWTFFSMSILAFGICFFVFYQYSSPIVVAETDDLEKMQISLSRLINNAPVLSWINGPDGNATWVSDGWLDFTGRPLSKEVGDGWKDNVHPDDLERIELEIQAAYATKRPFTTMYRLRHYSGQYRWIVDCGSPVYGSDQAFLGYVGTCLDIHQEKSKWEELGSLAASRAQLISDTSRHARDPLIEVYRLLQSLTHTLSNPDTHSTQNIISDCIGRLRTRFREIAGLIDQMVDQSLVSREDDNLKLSFQPALLSDVASSAVKMFEPRANQKGVNLSLTGGKEPLKGLFDVFRLERVFWTLLRVLIEELPPKSEIRLEIDRAGGPGTEWAQIKVTGISGATDRDASSDTAEAAGEAATAENALHWSKDLSLANRIVEKHSGIFEAHYAQDGSSEFKVIVPLKDAA